MPFLTAPFDDREWVDPDAVARLVVTFGFRSDTPGRFELATHSHAKSQIMLVQRGVLSCETAEGLWIVPPGSALWIPGATPHAVTAVGAIVGYGAFLSPQSGARLPALCCTMAVTPLLRELMGRASTLPLFYAEAGPDARLMTVLLDEVERAGVENLHLPMPDDPRLRRLVDMMIASPAERGTVADWAERSGLSPRSLERLIRRETGMSFGRWRRQLAVILAVQRLAGGASIQRVAADLGYESVPSFVTMFRQMLGQPPGRYMAERHRDGP